METSLTVSRGCRLLQERRRATAAVETPQPLPHQSQQRSDLLLSFSSSFNNPSVFCQKMTFIYSSSPPRCHINRRRRISNLDLHKKIHVALFFSPRMISFLQHNLHLNVSSSAHLSLLRSETSAGGHVPQCTSKTAQRLRFPSHLCLRGVSSAFSFVNL